MAVPVVVKIAAKLAADKKGRKIIGGIITGVLILLFLCISCTVSLFGSSAMGSGQVIDQESKRIVAQIADNLSDKSPMFNYRLYNAVCLFLLPEHETLDKEELALCFVTVNPDGTYSAILDSDTIYRNIEETFGITIFAEMKSAISDYMRLSAQAGLYGGDGSNIVEVAVSQLGNTGGEVYLSWYGFNRWENWCACFVSWCADRCGYIEAGIVPKFAVCDVAWFRERGQFQERDYLPRPGDIIFFDWESDGLDGLEDHVGIVEACDGETVYTIEGNTNGELGEVARHQYPVGYYEIFGYCTPLYPTETNIKQE